MSAFGERIKNLRDKKGQTQDDVGKILGKSRESISKYEKGYREPDLLSLTSLAKHFSVSTDYILGLNGDLSSFTGETSTDYTVGKSFNHQLEEYNDYLMDDSFIKYISLAVKLKNSNIDYNELVKIIDKIIAQVNNP